MFLGEKLSWLHYVALILSAVGAILISEPEFIFGSHGRENTLGSVLALSSGFFQAASFICARKSAHISVSMLTFSSLLLAVFMSLVPPLLPMFHTGSWQTVLDEPSKALGLVFMLLLLTSLSIALPAAGATRCPAAVSATVFTTSCMVSGYVSQMLFFEEFLSILTLCGAFSMLLSVVLMALPQPEIEKIQSLPSTASIDSTISLSSFVASEVSFNSTLRRRFFTGPELAQQIGLPVTST